MESFISSSDEVIPKIPPPNVEPIAHKSFNHFRGSRIRAQQKERHNVSTEKIQVPTGKNILSPHDLRESNMNI